VAVAPGEVGELVIGRCAEEVNIAFFEVFDVVAELDEFGGADEGEVFGVEKEERPAIGACNGAIGGVDGGEV